ncbi:MAG: HD domain-containing protein [Thiobacillus sp.]
MLMPKVGPDAMKEIIDINHTHQAHDDLFKVGRTAIALAKESRLPSYPESRRHENDAEHSFHLALSVVELASTYHEQLPEMDMALITQYALVHDLVEIITHDVPTFDISQEDYAKKEELEKQALKELVPQLSPHIGEMLLKYERQEDLESRFVRLVDKMMPVVIHMQKGSESILKTHPGIGTEEQLYAKISEKAERLQQAYPEFPFIHKVFKLINVTSSKHVFKEERQPISIDKARNRKMMGKMTVEKTVAL